MNTPVKCDTILYLNKAILYKTEQTCHRTDSVRDITGNVIAGESLCMHYGRDDGAPPRIYTENTLCVSFDTLISQRGSVPLLFPADAVFAFLGGFNYPKKYAELLGSA